ncbi:hypothetical protein [Stenotrophomonas maltophilia]|nr:hypothetical protein [Stenotrophomonas maltophilia]
MTDADMSCRTSIYVAPFQGVSQRSWSGNEKARKPTLVEFQGFFGS